MKNYYHNPVMLCFIALLLFSFPKNNFAQAPDLGSAANFVLFTPTGAVGSTGISNITGNVGSNNGEITGFDSLNGNIYNANSITSDCTADLLIAYDQLNSTSATIFPASVLGNGQTLYPGIYSIPEAASLNLGLTLDAQGDPAAIFIFKIYGAFSTTASSSIHLVNGAKANNIYWQVEGAVSMAAGSDVKGTFIANNGAFSMGADCTLEGRGLSTTGAISVYGVIAYIPGVILPVTLLEFKATKSGNAIDLTWISADESHLESYQIERSNDGRNFINIGTAAPTNTPFITNYKWIDYSPLSTISYYRLKMIDIGHVYKYSSIVRIDMNNRKNIAVYPNPVTGNTIMLQMYGQLKGEYTLSLFHTKGELLMSRRVLHDGKDAVRSIGLNKNFPAGFYFLHVSTANGNNVVLKIMIQ